MPARFPAEEYASDPATAEEPATPDLATELARNGEVIRDLVDDLVAKQQALSKLIDHYLAGEDQPPGEGTAGEGTLPLQDLLRLMALHSQNASRLGRLFRDKRALSGEAADGLAGAISQALDELSNEWGIEL